MIPGVECARKRRLHQRRGSTTTTTTTTRSFCLYARNLQSETSSQERMVLNQNRSFSDDKLGDSAREAKQRLDEKLTAHLKIGNQQRYNQKRNGLFRGFLQQIIC